MVDTRGMLVIEREGATEPGCALIGDVGSGMSGDG